MAGFVEIFCLVLVIQASAGVQTTEARNTSRTHSFGWITPKSGYSVMWKQESPGHTATLIMRNTSSLKNFEIVVSSSNEKVAWVLEESIKIKPCDNGTADKISVIISSALSAENDSRYEVLANDSDDSLLIEDETCYNVSFTIYGDWLGYADLNFKLRENSASDFAETELGTALVTVKRFYRMIDKLFVIIIRVMVGLAMFGMGTDLSLETIKNNLKKPKAPIIALFSQFTFMPLLSFSVIHILGLKGGSAMGMFMIGIAPGSGSSNMFCKLIGGDISVSVTLTTLSTIASVAIMPFWLYTLGTAVPASDEIGEIKIPFTSILSALALIVIPIAIGFLVQVKLSRVAKIIRKCLKVFFLVLILYFFTVGIYSNLYIYQSFDAPLVFGASVLPYGGYICGGLLAFVFRLNWTLIKTIALETGLQGAGVAILVLKTALPNPQSELAVVPTIAALFMSSIPLYLITAVYLIKQKFCTSKQKPVSLNEEGNDEKLTEMQEIDSENNDKLDEKTILKSDDEGLCKAEEEFDLVQKHEERKIAEQN